VRRTPIVSTLRRSIGKTLLQIHVHNAWDAREGVSDSSK
jgi:hypothetical protein